MGCLYKLTSPSGKSYIGISSIGFESRWQQHCRNAKNNCNECRAIYAAIRKYGPKNFTCKVLYEEDSWERLCEMESAAIIEHGTFSPGGYNLTLGGEGTVGCQPSETARRKMSEAQKRLGNNPKHAARRKESLKKAVSIRAKRWHARSAAEKEAWGKEHGEKVRRGHATEESRAKTIAAAKKRAADPALRKKLSEVQTGIKRSPWTEERKRRAAEQRKKEWADPVMRAKRLAGFARSRKGK